MNSLKKLNEKIRNELHLKEEEEDDDYGEEFLDDEEEEEEDSLDDETEDDKLKKDSRARIRVETESKIRGIIKNLDFEIKFRDLADKINDEIDGVVFTREKAHQLFNILRDLLEF